MAQPSLLPAEPTVIYAVPRWDAAWAFPSSTRATKRSRHAHRSNASASNATRSNGS